MNTKSKEAQFVAEVLARAGATPWIVDLSMKSHDVPGADVTGAQVAEAAGSSWPALNERTRQEAAAVMIEGGTRILLEKVAKGEVSGAIGLGRRERHRSRMLDPAGAALPGAQDHDQRSRRHGGGAVVRRRERHLHVSLDRRRLAQPRHQGRHGKCRVGGGDARPKTGQRGENRRPPMRHSSRSPRSAARRPASIT